MLYSADYIDRLKKGPFPSLVDPWAEVGHYFQQIHSEIISHYLIQIQDPLLKMGYIAGREASLQIAEGREPDIYIQRAMNSPGANKSWHYELAAEEILADPGIVVEAEFDLHALHIRNRDNGRLVTVVEVISPNNKTKPEVIADYRARRERLVVDNSVNVVEVDMTRSIKRLINDAAASRVAYHAVIYLSGESPHFIEMEFAHALKRIALPLNAQVLPLELQHAYDYAYQLVASAAQMRDNHFYDEDNLPFPSLLTVDQRQSALQAVQRWQDKLLHLRSENQHD